MHDEVRRGGAPSRTVENSRSLDCKSAIRTKKVIFGRMAHNPKVIGLSSVNRNPKVIGLAEVVLK